MAARVLWNRLEGDPTARTHMLLRVLLPEGDFLADVGFGGLTLTCPRRLDVGPEQPTPHEPRRLVAAGDEIELYARLDGQLVHREDDVLNGNAGPDEWAMARRGRMQVLRRGG